MRPGVKLPPSLRNIFKELRGGPDEPLPSHGSLVEWAERGFDRKYVTSVLAMLAGLLVIYSAGVTWLGLFARTGEAAPGVSAAFSAGVYPFIAPDLIKLAIAAGFVPALWRLLGRSH